MHDVKHIMKTIGATICCVLCLAVIALFVYTLVQTPKAIEPELYQISDNAFLNLFYRYLTSGVDFNPLILIVGLIALIFEILFSKPLRFLCLQLPLGRIFESDRQISVMERIFPALLIGMASGFITTYATFSPDSFSENAVWINWVILIILTVAFIAQFAVLFSNGGLWRVLVSGTLLVAANLGCGTLLGMIASMLGVAAAGLAICFEVLLFGIVIFIILAIASG